MRDESTTEDFNKWLKQWDAAAEQFAKESAAQITQARQQQDSFFTGTLFDKDVQKTEDDPSWRDIYYRSQEINGLIVDWDEGETKPKANFGAFTPTKTNPTQQSSTGADAVGKDGHVRVTKNWSDSDELRELDDIKRRIEEMERKHHEQEVLSEKPSKLKDEIEKLRERVHKLSEKINKEPEVDVT